MRTLAPLGSLLVVLIAVGCTSELQQSADEEQARALIGSWSADDTTRFVFQEGGDALWIIGAGAREETYRIKYDYAGDVEPAHLDLSGFDRGFLSGRTLYCIVAFDSVTVFRMDCEPGSGANIDRTEMDVRPDTFSQTTMTYRTTSTERDTTNG